MRIQHNIMSMNAYRNYNNNTKSLSSNLEKLSSGYKINRAGDDAAGLAISEKMRSQITGLEAAQKNVKDGVSLVKTAEGALQEVQDMLKRMKYLATQSANGTYENTVDRKNLQDEVNQLKDEIDRIADSANFNGIKLLDGTLGQRSVTYTAAAKAYDVQSIQVMGGGKGAAAAGPDAYGPQTNALDGMKAEVDGTDDKGTVTLTLKNAVKGIKWVAVGQEGGDKEFDDTETALEASFKGSKGGSVTFKAVRIDDADMDGTEIAADIDFYEGMTITVNVGAAERDTDGNFVGYGSTGLTTAEVGEATGLTLQIGDTSDNYNQLSVSIGDMHSSALGLDAVNIADLASAQNSIQAILDATNKVSSTRGVLGATQNRLDHTLNNLSVMTENIQDAESTIRDTDVADEMMAYTKNNILIQSAQAMLAQANAVPQGVLQLLQ